MFLILTELLRAQFPMFLALTVGLLYQHATSLILNLFVSRKGTVVVKSDDESFSFVAEYFAAHPDCLRMQETWVQQCQRRVWHWLVLHGCAFISQGSVTKVQVTRASDAQVLIQRVICKTTYHASDKYSKPCFNYIPMDGPYMFMHDGKRIDLVISTEQKDAGRVGKYAYFGHGVDEASCIQTGKETVTFTFSTTEASNDSIFRFIQIASQTFSETNHGKTQIYLSTANDYSSGGWMKLDGRPVRSVESIFLPDALKCDLMDDIRTFIKSEARYDKMGIPYRRGYMLHGPPGTGKSSFIFAVAGELGMNVCIVDLSCAWLDDSRLIQRLSSAPMNSLFVFEDVDVAMNFTKPVGSEKVASCKVTLSGLLNALDGIAAPLGRITFITTNCIESLPPALLRPGRVDRRFHFTFATAETAARLFEVLFEDCLGKEASVLGWRIVQQLGLLRGACSSPNGLRPLGSEAEVRSTSADPPSTPLPCPTLSKATGEAGCGDSDDSGGTVRDDDNTGLTVAQLQCFYMRYQNQIQSDPASILEHVGTFLSEIEKEKTETSAGVALGTIDSDGKVEEEVK